MRRKTGKVRVRSRLKKHVLGREGGWMSGGGKIRFKDCLQQSKSAKI